MEDGQIVEILAARDPLEANAVCCLLQGAGIRARVVGESINQIAGSLPLNGISSPRVWVSALDKDEALNLIKQWKAEQASSDQDGTTSDDWADQNPATEDESPKETSDGAGTVSAAGKVLIFAGAALILAGGVFTWLAYTKVQKCTAETAADFFYFKQRTTSRRVVNDALYHFRVNDRTYTARIEDVLPGHSVPLHTVAHYNPRDPEQYIIGEMASPWPPLILCGAIGSLLMLFAYRIG